mgnify:CR=1 FL=1
MALTRLTGTYVGFEELKSAFEKLPQPPKVVAEEIQEKFTAVNMAAKMDTSNLHHLIQEFVKLYREALEGKDQARAIRIQSILTSIGIEVTEDSWGFKGEHPEPIRMNAKLVLV